MKKIIIISANVLLRLFRGKSVWGLFLSASIFSVFIFSFARSDGVLLHELQIRIRYTLYFFTTLISVVVMYMACVSLRKDIDNRYFHTVSTASVHRLQIWLGKYCAIVVFGLLSFLTCSAVLVLCCSVFIWSWDKDSEKEVLKEKLFRSHYRLTPVYKSLRNKVDEEYRERRVNDLLPADASSSEVKHEILKDLKSEEQTLYPDMSAKWTFNWDADAPYGDHIILKSKFFAKKRRTFVKGTWTFSAPGSSTVYSVESEGYPYVFNELKIPLKDIPKRDILNLTFSGDNTSYMIFQRSSGVALLYDSGSLFKNYLYLLFFSFLHICALAALAFTLSSFFSYSVAVFVGIVFYCVGVASTFFSSVLTELSLESDSIIAALGSGIIQFGMWLTAGIQAPPVVKLFSQGISIPFNGTFFTWGVGAVIYIAFVGAVGIYVLTIKEIDKIPYS